MVWIGIPLVLSLAAFWLPPSWTSTWEAVRGFTKPLCFLFNSLATKKAKKHLGQPNLMPKNRQCSPGESWILGPEKHLPKGARLRRWSCQALAYWLSARDCETADRATWEKHQRRRGSDGSSWGVCGNIQCICSFDSLSLCNLECQIC